MSKKFKAHFILNEMLLIFKQIKQNEDQKLNQNWMKNCLLDLKENRKIGVSQVKPDRCRSNTNTFCSAFSDDNLLLIDFRTNIFFCLTLCNTVCPM